MIKEREIPTRAEALARVKDAGYVRIGGHSATSVEEVHHVYDVRMPAWDEWEASGRAAPTPEPARVSLMPAPGPVGEHVAGMEEELETLRARNAALEAAVPNTKRSLEALNVEQLQMILRSRGVDFDGALSKAALIDLILPAAS